MFTYDSSLMQQNKQLHLRRVLDLLLKFFFSPSVCRLTFPSSTETREIIIYVVESAKPLKERQGSLSINMTLFANYNRGVIKGNSLLKSGGSVMAASLAFVAVFRKNPSSVVYVCVDCKTSTTFCQCCKL